MREASDRRRPGARVPGGRVVAAPVRAARPRLSTGIAPGTHGAAVAFDALFQGCELENGRAWCAFHGEGRKWRAAYDGATPRELLLALEAMAVNTPVRVEADRIGPERLHTSLVLRAVARRDGGDAFADLRAALQGDWESRQDGRLAFTIRGSELYTRYDGDFRGVRFIALAEGCAAAGGRGPALIQTRLRDGANTCLVIERLGEGVLELTDPERGVRLGYAAAR